MGRGTKKVVMSANSNKVSGDFGGVSTAKTLRLGTYQRTVSALKETTRRCGGSELGGVKG